MAGALLNIVLNYFGIKYFGYVAAAYTTLFCYIVFAFGHYVYMSVTVKKALSIEKTFNSGRLVVLSVVLVGFCLFTVLFYDSPIIRYLMILVILCVLLVKRKQIQELYKTIRTHD